MNRFDPEALEQQLARIRLKASARLDERVARLAQELDASGMEPLPLERKRKKFLPLALAAGIAGLLICGALLWGRFHSRGNDFVTMPAISLFREACAAEDSLFKGEGAIGIVNEFIVKPISDPELARLRFLPVNSMMPTGKLSYDMLSLPAKPGEGYSVDDRSWYDQKTGRFARVMTVGGKAIFANSYDGALIYRLEPDAAGLLKVVSKPVAANFRPPLNPGQFLGGTALGGPAAALEKQGDFSDAGEVTLPDGSAARIIKISYNLTSAPEEMREKLSDTYVLFTIRKSDNTIAQAEFVMNGQSSLVMRRRTAAPAAAPDVPWNLAGIEVQPAGAAAAGAPTFNPKVLAGAVILNASVGRMVEKADFETYVFARNPPWASKCELADVLDPLSPPQRMFVLSYVASDHRHVILVQSPSYNKMIGQVAKTGTLSYTSPNGCKVWSAPEARGKWLAGILLQSTQFVTKEKPAENRTGLILETPAGTFPALAINGKVTDAELHSLIDSLIPAKKYLKNSPTPTAVGSQGTETTSP
jgi:hypothetical protein